MNAWLSANVVVYLLLLEKQHHRGNMIEYQTQQSIELLNEQTQETLTCKLISDGDEGLLKTDDTLDSTSIWEDDTLDSTSIWEDDTSNLFYEDIVSIKNLTMTSFKNDGFKQVCDVCTTSTADMWTYININNSVMYDSHCGWVYIITVDGIVFKIGETGGPLAKRPSRGNQPVGGTKARLSRYRTHKDHTKYDTDHEIRTVLQKYLDKGAVITFWARKCKASMINEIVLGESYTMDTGFHKILEKKYLSMIFEEYGRLPPLHKSIS